MDWPLSKIARETAEGAHDGSLPDGITYKGRIVIKKVDEDNWTWEFVGKTGDGADHKMSGKLKRKK